LRDFAENIWFCYGSFSRDSFRRFSTALTFCEFVSVQELLQTLLPFLYPLLDLSSAEKIAIQYTKGGR
jgi:hypothetical protein